MLEYGIVTALITALVEGIKRMNIIPTKFLPLAAIVLGCAAYIFFIPGELTVREAIFWGIATGGSSCGMFSAIKNVGQGLTEKDK